MGIRTSSVIIDDFYIPSVTVSELERDPPGTAGRNSPLVSARTAQPMKADGGKTR
jgi:hypothetical protein